MAPREPARPHRNRESTSRLDHHEKRRSKQPDSDGSGHGRKTQALSAGALAKLEEETRRNTRRDPGHKKINRAEYREVGVEKARKQHKSKKRRMVSGAMLEEGSGARLRGGGGSTESSFAKGMVRNANQNRKSRRRIWIILGFLVALVVVVVVVVVVVTKKTQSSAAGPSTSSLDGKDRNSVPKEYQGTYLDPWSWVDTTDFNVTFTAETVGDLPLIGLMTTWDDSKAASDQVPALDKPWGSYSDRPARGVNLGGWLALEPFITPSLFTYELKDEVVDEYTLCRKLGGSAASTLERHYATFVTESTFKEIADAGLDHIRIPFSYWAVEHYDDDPYVFRTSWRYLLRGIEWARKHGLRINLDLHGVPGSQNGWNHSGRFGSIGWLNGPDGAKNRQRSLDIHDRLSKFFAQDRYKNIVAFYGLANEPKMISLPVQPVISWTEEAYKTVRSNGMNAVVVFGDGFLGSGNWQGALSEYTDLALDIHQYVIFNSDQIALTHKKKIQYACQGWTTQAEESMDKSTGFGPTLFAEWSQADTDCAKHLTNVGWGNRWTGTLDTGNSSDSILTPRCPTRDSKCSCVEANAEVSRYSSPYRQFLKMFAEAQMHSFEKGWGWWYWTWQTENAPQWSYKAGMAAGILPKKAYEREFDCSQNIPDFEGLPETY